MKNFILFLFFGLITTTCSNEDKSEKKPATAGEEPAAAAKNENSNISFKANNTTIQTKTLAITRIITGQMPLLNIITDREVAAQTINITINGHKPGVYQFADGIEAMRKEGVSFGSYTPDTKNDLMNIYSFVEGRIELLVIDTTANVVNAIFSGTAKNAKGEIVNITEGKIDAAPMNPGILKQ